MGPYNTQFKLPLSTNFISAADSCVPWRLPYVEGATRDEVLTPDGWKVTLQCPGLENTAGDGRAPHVLSYHYLDNPTVFTCTSGQKFFPEGSFSCQSKLTRYKAENQLD